MPGILPRIGMEWKLETPPGLPLGVVRDTAWEETGITLQPGDRMVWMSNGVLEARDKKRALLGFERAQELASRSASEIARDGAAVRPGGRYHRGLDHTDSWCPLYAA